MRYLIEIKATLSVYAENGSHAKEIVGDILYLDILPDVTVMDVKYLSTKEVK